MFIEMGNIAPEEMSGMEEGEIIRGRGERKAEPRGFASSGDWRAGRRACQGPKRGGVAACETPVRGLTGAFFGALAAAFGNGLWKRAPPRLGGRVSTATHGCAQREGSDHRGLTPEKASLEFRGLSLHRGQGSMKRLASTPLAALVVRDGRLRVGSDNAYPGAGTAHRNLYSGEEGSTRTRAE